MTWLIIAVLLPLVVSFSAVYLLKQFAWRRKLLDLPGAIKAHSTPKPRLGGIGLFLGWSLGLLVLFLAGQVPFEILLYLCGVCAAFLLVGVVDDLHPLRPLHKISLLALVTFAAVAFLPASGWFRSWAGLLFSFVWILGVVNAVNMVDGLDGLAGSVVWVASAALLGGFFLTDHFSWGFALLPLVGAIPGFLAWNFPPAKIFMGDGGSTFLGFILAIFSLVGSGPTLAFSSLGWAVIISVFLLELLLTVFRRVRSHQSLAAGDLEHSYNRMQKSNHSDWQVLVSFLLLALTVGSCGLVMILTDQTWVAVLAFVLCLSVGLLFTKKQHLF